MSDEQDKYQRERQVKPLPLVPPSPHYEPEGEDPSTLNVDDKDSYQPMRLQRVTDATDAVMNSGWGCTETYKTKNQGK
jgi:hypothetical protein